MNTPQTSAPDIHRLLPQDKDAEVAVLGSIFRSPESTMELCIEKRLEPESFHVPAHVIIYGHIRSMFDSAKPIDFILLTSILRGTGELDKVGGPAFITALSYAVPTSANAAYYIDLVISKQVMRGVIVTCTGFASEAYEETEDALAYLDKVEAGIHAIAERHVRSAACTMREYSMAALDSIEALYERKGSVSGLTTGFEELDRMIDGLKGPDMIVLAARPSMGKTALAMNIVEHVALTLKAPVGVFSLEMSGHQLAQRMICTRAKINMQKLQAGFLNTFDIERIGAIGAIVAQSPIQMDDTAGLSILELRTKARRMKKRHDIKLIVIDYLQLLTTSKKSGKDNREREIAEISSGVKSLAKELNIPIIVLAQLNRNPEGRTGGKPRLSDLRESGSIEQDADIVALLNREERYADDKTKESVAGQAILDIAKSRNGPVGEIPLTFIKQFTKFETRARVDQIEP